MKGLGLFLYIFMFSIMACGNQFNDKKVSERGRPQRSFVVEKLRFPEEFIFNTVLERMRQTNNPSIPRPKIYFESATPLKQFQDAIEEQWSFRPEVISNAYSVKNNEIYLTDDAAYYKRTKRSLDDSLVHELVHYVQTKYRNETFDDSSEMEAIDIQTWFRNTYSKELGL